MSRQHDLDEIFPTDLDDAVENDLRQLFIALQSPGTTEELSSEASVVAAMAHAMDPQTSSFQSSTRRAPMIRAIGSRAAKVAVVTAIAVISTSAAAAAGLLPRPVQSAVERAAQYVGWHLPERDEPATTTMEHPEPTPITTSTDRPDAAIRSTEPPSVAVDRSLTTDELCRGWAFSIRSGVPLEPDATRALSALAERAGQVVERLCRPYAPTAPEVPAATEATTTPATVPTPTVSTVSPAVVPTASTAPPSTNNTTPNPSHTMPPQAHGNGPPLADEPSRGENPPNGTGNANSNANANANPNPNPNAPAGLGNANGNGAANANGATIDPPNANANANGNGNATPHGGG
jgi:hypothetical protein